MATIASLIVDIKADITDITANTKKAAQSVEGMASQIGTAMKVMGSSMIVGEVVDFVKTIAAAADQIDKLSGQLDDTVLNVQRLEAAAMSADAELEAMATGVQHLQSALASGKGAEGFAKLNLSVKELRDLSPVELYIAVAEALGRVQNRGEQLAIAQELGLKNAKALASTFRDDLGKSAEPWLAASEEAVQGFDLLSTGFGKATQAAKNFAMELLTNVSGMQAWVRARDAMTVKASDLPTPPPPPDPSILSPGASPAFVLPIAEAERIAAAATEKARLEALATEELAKQHEWNQALATDAVQVADGWLSVWERVKEINAEMRIGLTLEGQRLNNAIALNAIKAAEANAASDAIIERMNPVAGPDAVSQINDRAAKEIAELDPTLGNFLTAQQAIINRATLEIQMLSQAVDGVTGSTDKATQSAERLHGAFAKAQGVMSRSTEGSYGGWVDPEGNPTTQERSAVLQNMPALMRPQNLGVLDNAPASNTFNISGVMATDQDAMRRLIEQILMERATLGTPRSGAR